MKLKDFKNDNNYITVSVDFDDNEIKQIENSSYILLASRLNPETGTNISKNRINKIFGPDYLKRSSLDLVMPKTAEFLKDNIEEDLLAEPALMYIDTDNGFNLDLVAYEIPEFELFNYKEELVHPELDLSKTLDDQVRTRLEELQRQNVRLEPTDKAFEEGNTVSIDINFGDEERTESNVILNTDDLTNFYELNDFIGKNVDEEFETKHNNQEISVKINQIYNPELPEIDDDFAAEVSEFDTLDELKENLKEEITEKSKESYQNSIEWEDWNQLFNKTELIDTNENLLNYKNDDKFKMIVTYLLNCIKGTPVYLPQMDNFELSIYMNLCLAIAKKVLEEEGIDIESEINSLYDDFKAGNDLTDKLSTIYIQDISLRNPESETESAYVKKLIEQGLTFQKTKEVLDQYIRLENSQEEEK